MLPNRLGYLNIGFGWGEYINYNLTRDIRRWKNSPQEFDSDILSIGKVQMSGTFECSPYLIFRLKLNITLNQARSKLKMWMLHKIIFIRGKTTFGWVANNSWNLEWSNLHSLNTDVIISRIKIQLSSLWWLRLLVPPTAATTAAIAGEMMLTCSPAAGGPRSLLLATMFSPTNWMLLAFCLQCISNVRAWVYHFFTHSLTFFSQ